ncbi:hypothetical protein D3C81_1778980 [compost metagenome]
MSIQLEYLVERNRDILLVHGTSREISIFFTPQLFLKREHSKFANFVSQQKRQMLSLEEISWG